MSDIPKQNSDDQPNDVTSNIGAVTDQLIERELHDSYLTYAMSTIMDRGLPDVRDGLKRAISKSFSKITIGYICK